MTSEKALEIIEFKLGRGKEAERLGFHNDGVYSWRGRISEEREALEMAIKYLSVPEREKGEWIEEKTFGEGFYHCSVCGGVSTAFVAPKLYKFCPFCGADMRGGKE